MAEAGPLTLPSRRPFDSDEFVVMRGGGAGRPSRGISCPPIGVASRSCGAAGRADERCGILTMSGTSGTPLSWTGRAVGDGGMPSFNFGGRRGLGLGWREGAGKGVGMGAAGGVALLGVVSLILFLGAPGTGGLSSGTGAGDGVDEEDGMARLFCLSPGKNNSLGSARVASLAVGWDGSGELDELGA